MGLSPSAPEQVAQQDGLPFGVSPPAGTQMDQTFWRSPLGRQVAELGLLPVVKRHGGDGCQFIQRVVPPAVPRGRTVTDYADDESLRFRQILCATEQDRTYVVHVPSSLQCSCTSANATKNERTIVWDIGGPRPCNLEPRSAEANPRLFPAVVLFHGTDELCFDSEMMEHVSEALPRQTWLDLSDNEDVIVISLQSRAQWAEHTSCWRTGDDALRSFWVTSFIDHNMTDMLHVTAALDDARANVFARLNADIDLARLYCIGFSNGGYMAADVALSHLESYACPQDNLSYKFRMPSSAPGLDPERPFYRFAAVCMYMGGVTETHMEATGRVTKETLPPWKDVADTLDIPNENDLPRVLIVTGDWDTQLIPCCEARKLMVSLGYPCAFIQHKNAKHEFDGRDTATIYNFFKESHPL